MMALYWVGDDDSLIAGAFVEESWNQQQLRFASFFVVWIYYLALHVSPLLYYFSGCAAIREEEQCDHSLGTVFSSPKCRLHRSLRGSRRAPDDGGVS